MHMGNFGTLQRPSGEVFIGINDFDEAHVGSATRDLKRFGTSVVLAAQQAGFHPSETRRFVSNFADTYHDTLQQLTRRADGVEALKVAKPIRVLLDQVDEIDAEKWLKSKTKVTRGRRLFERSDRVTSVSTQTAANLKVAYDTYRSALPKQTANELVDYRISDAVAAIAGTGSVGRARYRLLLEARDKPAIVLELKETVPVALAPPASSQALFGTEANRVVMASQVLNGKLEPLLGTTTLPEREALQSTSFLVRRLFPTKAAIDPTAIDNAKHYARLVRNYAQAIAIGHANGEKVSLAGAEELLAGIGDKKAFAEALVDFSHRYAQQVHRDYRLFKVALKREPLLRRP
jgi:uncharacterized protein (DUF2252 family)